ncbi:MAG: dynamin family protein [Chthoniobacteraceae bacterium]
MSSFPPALSAAAEKMDAASDKELLHEPLAALNDIRARLRSLCEKLANQQAYLLIFGPLKSGKSTLMNAISGSYVSEVTSLPGYPCLVYVQHAEEPHFSATRYNGRETVFADANVLRDMVADSHVALAQQIRATEERGAEFNPRTNFTEAIRRIDVKLPVAALGESSTVLVDTPGLYSRMNFGYDVLTREFRDSAACAVFVVKTDNLFLEQVFAEFNQLLNLFSRIFLVINVDSSKRDLHSDGTLKPSAESQHPERIIEAFRTLSMSGPLREAYQKDRVRIHAVDLLSAASAFLTTAATGGNGNGTNGEHAQKAAFDTFLRDLTDYLNSSDYTQEFIRDSLKQGHTLCTEARAVAERGEVRQLRDTQTRVEAEMREIDDKLAAVDRLLQVDWEAAFKLARTENATRCEGAARGKSGEVAKSMRDALDRWYAGNGSLQALEQEHWNRIMVESADALAIETRARLGRLLGGTLGGAEPAAATMTDLHAIGFNLGRIASGALPGLDQREASNAYQLKINVEELPVRKSFVDWILFRGAATVRRRLFGEDLTQEIAPELKAKRLPQSSREVLETMIDAGVKEKFHKLPAKYSEELLTAYVAKFRADMLENLRQHREQLANERAARQAPFESNAAALTALDQLSEQAAKVAADIRELAKKENVLPPGDEVVEAPAPSPAEIASAPADAAVESVTAEPAPVLAAV